MTSILAGHGGAAIGKAEVNALPKDTRTGVADRTLGSLRPRLLIFAVNIDHLIKTNSGMWFLFHSTSAQVSTEVAVGPKVKWKQMKWPGVDNPPPFFLIVAFFNSTSSHWDPVPPSAPVCMCVVQDENVVYDHYSGWPQSAQPPGRNSHRERAAATLPEFPD